MGTASENKASKQQRILDSALRIIRDQGDAGLTMRKIADCSGMRLSNLQYYFKSKDDVLAAMVTSYFRDCESELKNIADSCESMNRRNRVRRMMTEVLHHGTELSDMCRIFRELWAISTRNEVVRKEMMKYYESLCSVIEATVLGGDGSAKQTGKVGSLLLPFIEGYSITAPSLPMPLDQVADMLTDLTMDLIEDE